MSQESREQRVATLTVIVVAYGPVDQLRRCLISVSRAFPVSVVDNGLSDEAEAVCAEFGASYQRPPQNLGFGAAVNLALASRGRDDVLLLNPDAEIDSRAVRVLHDRLRSDPRLAAVAPRLINPDGTDQKVLWPVPSPRTVWADVVGLSNRSTFRFLSGAVLLLRAEALSAVGGFDERFFLYAEETDWQMRAQREGWRIALVEEVSARHASGGTSSDPLVRELFFNASAERLIRKWYGTLGWQLFRVGSIAAALRRMSLAPSAAARRQQWRAVTQYAKGPVRTAEMEGAFGSACPSVQ